jgi:acetyltransferase-like isoleucine patch superfamily enzyme
VLFAAVSSLFVVDSPRAGTARARVLAWHGAHIGRNPFICRGFELHGGSGENLWIGDDVFINANCRIDARAPVQIGSRVAIGPGVTLWTTTHAVGGPAWRADEMRSAPIAIGDGVWVGVNTTVLGGVTIGSGAVIGAGAVVVADVEPNTFAAGVPAKVIRKLSD